MLVKKTSKKNLENKILYINYIQNLGWLATSKKRYN